MISRIPVQPYDEGKVPGVPARPLIREIRWEGRLPRPRGHTALVVVYSRGGGEYLVIWPHRQGGRVLLSRNPSTAYEVDIGLYSTVITEDLPCREYAGVFHATMTVLWRVTDPAAVVRHQVLDVEKLLRPDLLRRARAIARDYSADQMSGAEDEINQLLGGVSVGVGASKGSAAAASPDRLDAGLGSDYGLSIQVVTHLALDDAAAAHNATMMKLRWAIEEEEAEHRLRLIKDRNVQAITKERTDLYRKIIAAGDVERFALRLANNPADIDAITEIIREDQVTSRKDTIDFISHMVDSGVIERWEVSDQVREALRWLLDATSRVVGDKEHVIGNASDAWRRQRRGRAEAQDETAITASPGDVTVVKDEPVRPDAPPDSAGTDKPQPSQD